MDKFGLLLTFNINVLNALSLSISALRKLRYSTASIKRNNEMAKYKKNDTLYVLGLGPSLKKVDIAKLDGDIICSNRFYKFQGAQNCIPQFYCLMDDEYFAGKAIDDFLAAYKLYPNTQFLLNGKYKCEIESLIGKQNNIFYIYGWSGLIRTNSTLDFTKNLPLALNVVCRMIEAGIYMNYRSIVLLGCDFNSFAMLKDKHCYNDNEDNVQWRLSYELFCYAFAAKEHEILEIIAQNKGIDILNATEGSLIDAYRRININKERIC